MRFLLPNSGDRGQYNRFSEFIRNYLIQVKIRKVYQEQKTEEHSLNSLEAVLDCQQWTEK